MSKKQQIADLERDYATVIRQRDGYKDQIDAEKYVAEIRTRRQADAEIQEKVDGIKAGLIPTSELRKAFDELTIDADGVAFVTYRFDRDVDRVQKAISDVLTAKPKDAGARVTLGFDPASNRRAGETWYLTGLPVL